MSRLWNWCAFCGKRIEMGEKCYGLPNGESVCTDCCVAENRRTTMAEYIERTEELMLAMNAGARAIENTKRYHSSIYTKDVFSESPQEIPYLQAAKVLREVSDAPAADVATVVHGRKIEDGDIGCFWLCSLCGECLPYGANYCPNCGAKMDGGGEDAAD